MKLRKRDLFLLVAAPALMLGAIGTVAGLQAASKADEVRAEAAEGKIATYTTVSQTEISSSGEAPVNSSATYDNTYAKEQLTSGHSATFTLSGYDGKYIRSIKMQMHSNSSKGAGTVTIAVGSTEIVNTGDKKFNAMFGRTSWSTSFVEVTAYSNDAEDLTECPRVGENEDIVITISASANSLYIKSYTIEWDEENATFFAGKQTKANLSFDYTSQTEETGSTTITLPSGNSWGTSSQGSGSREDGGINASWTNGMKDTASLRVYKNANLTITAPNTITKIVITGNGESGYAVSNFTADSGTYQNGTWTGSADRVIFTAGAQVRLSTIAVTYEGGSATTYSNFDNAKIQFAYTLSNLTDEQEAEVNAATEMGIFVTDDESFDFTAVTDTLTVAEGKVKKKYHIDGKEFGLKIGINIPAERYTTKLCAAGYMLKDDGKYYFCKAKKYSVRDMLDVYSNAEYEDTTDDEKALCASFANYIDSLQA